MKEIQLSRGMFALVDDEDFDFVSQFTWHALQNGKGNFYAARRKVVYSGKPKKAYRISLMQWDVFGEALYGFRLDHEDRNTLNNQKQNLRFISHGENIINSARIDAATNIRKHGNRWQIRIMRNRVLYQTSFADYEDAINEVERLRCVPY